MAFENYGSRSITLPKANATTELRNNPNGNVTKEIKKRVEDEAELAKIEIKKTKSRAKYMREYRKKPKLCPHCHKDIRT